MNFEIPAEVIAGDTLDFKVEVPEFPSSAGWTLKYRLTPRFSTPTQTPITLTASANADGSYQVQASNAATSGYQPGAYTWARWVEKAGARQTLDQSGQLVVKADPAATVQGYDSRSHERKMLEQVQAAMLALNTGVKSYTIGSRQMTYRDMPELIAEESRLKWLVANEDARAKIAAGQPNPRDVRIRFGSS